MGLVEVPFEMPAGLTVQASIANGAAAATAITAPAGITLLADFLAGFQTQLNNNVQGYPLTAVAIAAAIGYGTWTTGAGYLCNEASGNLASIYGTPATLTAAGTPLYGIIGPRSGIDKAIGFDANADQFAGGTGDFDVSGTNDLIIAWVGRFIGTPSASEFLFVKGNAGAAARWNILHDSGINGSLKIQCISTSGTKESALTATTLINSGSWYVGIAAIDRGAGTVRIGVRTLTGTETLGANTALFAGETLSNTDAFTFGNRSVANACLSQQFGAFYVATGSGCAAGIPANISTALANFANAVNAGWLLTRSSSTGLVSIGYSAPPAGIPSFSLDWTSTTLRDVLGFTADIDYPTTAAQVATQLGYGTWTTGAGYLCNEASGNLASVFGAPASLTATSLVYGLLGPRGGIDKAIGFDATTDNADGGNAFDVIGTSDLIVLWVAFCAAGPPASNRALLSKFGGSTTGWYIQYSTDGTAQLQLWKAGPSQDAVTAGVAIPVGNWYVGIACIDRSTNKARFGICPLGGSPTVSAEVNTTAAASYTTAGTLRIGQRSDSGASSDVNHRFTAVYVVSGSGVATGLSANLSSALATFAAKFGTRIGTQLPKGVAFTAPYESMLKALIPPGRVWR